MPGPKSSSVSKSTIAVVKSADPKSSVQKAPSNSGQSGLNFRPAEPLEKGALEAEENASTILNASIRSDSVSQSTNNSHLLLNLSTLSASFRPTLLQEKSSDSSQRHPISAESDDLLSPSRGTLGVADLMYPMMCNVGQVMANTVPQSVSILTHLPVQSMDTVDPTLELYKDILKIGFENEHRSLVKTAAEKLNDIIEKGSNSTDSADRISEAFIDFLTKCQQEENFLSQQKESTFSYQKNRDRITMMETLSAMVEKLSLNNKDLLLSCARTSHLLRQVFYSKDILIDGIKKSNVNLLQLCAASGRPLPHTEKMLGTGQTILDALIEKKYYSIIATLLSNVPLHNGIGFISPINLGDASSEENVFLSSLRYYPNELEYDSNLEQRGYKRLISIFREKETPELMSELEESEKFKTLFLNYPSGLNKSFICEAIERGSFNFVKWIIKKCPTSLGFQTDFYRDNVFYMAIRNGSLAIFDVIYTQKNEMIKEVISCLPISLEDYALQQLQLSILNYILMDKYDVFDLKDLLKELFRLIFLAQSLPSSQEKTSFIMELTSNYNQELRRMLKILLLYCGDTSLVKYSTALDILSQLLDHLSGNKDFSPNEDSTAPNFPIQSVEEQSALIDALFTILDQLDDPAITNSVTEFYQGSRDVDEGHYWRLLTEDKLQKDIDERRFEL